MVELLGEIDRRFDSSQNRGVVDHSQNDRQVGLLRDPHDLSSSDNNIGLWKSSCVSEDVTHVRLSNQHLGNNDIEFHHMQIEIRYMYNSPSLH